MSLFRWSRTAASNGTADPTCSFPEGMAPSAYNDGMRGAMAAIAQFRDDISGAIVTGGSSTAYTVASYSGYDTLAHLDGQMIAFTPHATNTNAVGVDVTLSVDGLGAKPIRMQPGVALPNGTLILGTPYIGYLNNSDGAIYLHNTIDPYAIPLGAGIDYWGSTAPNTSFAFPTGQAISRTTYAALFSLIGTTYGIGDGSTTFNLPDKTGRVSAMKEGTATRLTSGAGGVDGATLGAAGGSQTETLSLSQLPTGITVTGTVSVSSGSNDGALVQVTGKSLTNITVNNGSNTAIEAGLGANSLSSVASFSGSNTLTSNNTSGAAHPIVPPLIVCNYIMRII